MVIKRIINCMGCGCCAAFCPNKCIDMVFDNYKFYRPVLNYNKKCIECNLCDQICPVLNKVDFQNTPKAFSITANDKETLMSVTSGGACYEIAKSALSQGYKVCAVVYDYEKYIAKHTIITDLKDLEKTKGSKYMQSFTVDAFRQLFDGSKYAVFGTPCQIAGIEKYAVLKNMRDNFLLVDFFCHGTPSMKLWQKYISEIRKKISRIHFRSKEFGWHKFAFKFEFDDGTSFSDVENIFYTLYLGNYCLNNSCYNCLYKALNSRADIRTGDFWGSKYNDIDTGVSSVLAFTGLGLKFVEELKNSCKVTDETIGDILEGQMVKSPAKPRFRKIVLRCLNTGISLHSIYHIILFPFRLFRKIKKIVKR